MGRRWIWLLAIAVFVGATLSGCAAKTGQPGAGEGKGGQPPGQTGETPSGNQGGANEPANAEPHIRKVLEDFMAYRQQGKRAEALQLFTEAGAAGIDQIPFTTSNPKFMGYRVVEALPTEGGRHHLKVQVFYHYTGSSDSYRVEDIAFKWEQNRFEIDQVKLLGERSVAIEGKQLTLSKPDGKSKLIDMTNVPDQFGPYPQGDPAAVFGVSKARFVDVALAPSGKLVAFFTGGEVHGFLGLAGEDGKVTGLDLYFEGDGRELAFSHDSRYLATTVHRPSDMLTLHVWDVTTHKPVELKGLPRGEAYTDLRWTDEELLFKVKTGTHVKEYRWSLKTGQVTPAPAAGK